MSATWGDYDSDGLLDLYVTNYMECTGPWTTEAEVIANVAYDPDVLYHNEGDGTFDDVTSDLPGQRHRRPPASPPPGSTSTSDGRLDLFVGNDFVGISPDQQPAVAQRRARHGRAGSSATCRSSRAPGST